MVRGLAETERRKYEKCWRHLQYRFHSPGEKVVDRFRKSCRPRRGETLVDLGCGTGRGGKKLKDEFGLQVTLMDFAENCRDVEVEKDEELPFIKSNLWTPFDGHWKWGYCCDVMEHIPPERVDAVLENAAETCDRLFFHICNRPDHFGDVIGQPLHLSVFPFVWWRDKLREFGQIRDGRDLIYDSLFYVRVR